MVTDNGFTAAYHAADPLDWQRAAADARALDVAEAAARTGREAVRTLLGFASMSRIDKLVAAARDCQADPARHALALAIQPAIMRAALIDAAGDGWTVEPRTGTVVRRYDAAGVDVTKDPAGVMVYERMIRVDLGTYCYGVGTPELRAQAPKAFVMDGNADDPAEAVRAVLALPLPV